MITAGVGVGVDGGVVVVVDGGVGGVDGGVGIVVCGPEHQCAFFLSTLFFMFSNNTVDSRL